MSKKTRSYIILAGIVMVIIGLITLIVFKVLKANSSDNERFANEYREVAKNNVFVYKNPKQTIKLLESGTGVVYLGFEDCPWCQEYVPILNEAAKESDIENIYYCNIKDIRNKNTSDYQKIVKLVKNYLSKDDEGNKRIYAPDVYVVKDGKILSHNNDTSIMIGDVSSNDYWTDLKKQELKNKLKLMFSELEK